MPIALVTGATRGVGRGVAIALADAGFKVYATGRSISAADLPPHITRVVCDHAKDDQTSAVFDRIRSEAGELDVLVNSCWGGYERMVENGRFTWMVPFWEQPLHRWTSMMDAGVRAAFVCSAQAARLMVPRSRGLIANISFWAAQKHIGNALYGVSKAATDKITSDTAHELKPHNIAFVSLYPGMVRTECVMQAASEGWLDTSNSESPEFIGRVIAGLYSDSAIMERTGRVVVAAEFAREKGILDVDGKQPVPLSLEKV